MMNKPRQYVALLRAINVGKRTVAMGDLKKLFETANFGEVSTYINTGNVVFTAGEGDLRKLAETLEKALLAHYGFSVQILILTPEELQEAEANNPFDPECRDSDQLCHLLFLWGKPASGAWAKVKAMEGDEYRFALHDKVFFYAYDRSAAGSRRRNLDFEKVLGVTGTARSWKVVRRLIEMTG